MRFITEFEMPPSKYINKEGWAKNSKEWAKAAMGADIINAFNFEGKLEIEAFPMDKWIEFKQKLFTELSNSIDPSRHIINEVKVLKLIKELESFGKPAGSAK